MGAAIIVGADEGPSRNFVQTGDQSIIFCMGRRQLTHNQKYSHHLLFIRKDP